MAKKNTNDWQGTIESAQTALGVIQSSIEFLTAHRDAATAEISKYLRMEGKGIDVDLEAVKATISRPYTILPINEHEAWLIHWRGIKMPIFGWVVAQEPAFIKAKVTRSMDLLTPLPVWMKDELGWKPPEHKAVIDGTRTGLMLNEGDEGSFKRKYGHFIGAKQADGTFKIKGGDAWIKLVAALVRDGILPYTPEPVHNDYWDTGERFGITKLYTKLLKDLIDKKQDEAGDKYINRAISEFYDKGAVLVNYPPGSGKTLTTCAILNHFKGRVLILADSVMLIEQWRDRVKTLAANSKSEIVFSTYQGAGKYLNEEWDLIVFDEAQRLPANTFSKLAFVKTKYRLGLTGTPWREDERQHLIVALSGFPVAIRWAELISAGVLKRPRIIVATVPSEAAKTNYVKSLIAKRKGRAMVFCDWIEQGQALADALDVPFVHGGTARKLEKVQESDVCVVSRIGDRGVSLPDLRLVIEVAGAGSAREQFAQRVGRLLHGEFTGEFYTVFTPEEAAKYRGRIFGVEAELAGEVDIEFIEVGNVDSGRLTVGNRKKAVNTTHKPTSRPIVRKNRNAAKEGSDTAKGKSDEISITLEVPSIAAKVNIAKNNVMRDAVGYIERVLRYCWTVGLSHKEIAEGLGLTGSKTLTRISVACKACVKVSLMNVDADGRYKVNQDEIQRLKALSSLRNK
jgi:hypothetical protein